MSPDDLLATIASVAPHDRDAVVEAHLGLGEASSASPGRELVGYHASSVAAIVRTLIEVPVTEDDVFIDLGSGLGLVVVLANLLTGATARGIEMQPALVERARAFAVRHDARVDFVNVDMRKAAAFIEEGTVFFLYLPCTGSALEELLERLHEVAARRAIVICALGVDLERFAGWLARRSVDSFWLAIYDSVVPGVAPRPTRARSSRLGAVAEAIAFSRVAP